MLAIITTRDSFVGSKDAPIISIGQLVRWYRPIVVCTVGKYKFLFLLPKVNKHDGGFRFR